ncbi:MAG: PDZ domain-containing protein [Anaerolineae bacterium]|nr:PDZ domain-containing protein [Anaerolineae bacterium]
MRSQVCGFLLVVSLVGVIIAPVRAQEDTGQTPQEYLEIALDYIQQNSIYTDRIDDWEALRADAFAMIDGATTTQETYPAIRYVIDQLGDHHSSLLTAELSDMVEAGQGETIGLIVVADGNIVIAVFPDSPAASAGIQQGDVVLAIDGEPLKESNESAFANVEVNHPATFTIQRNNDVFEVYFAPAVVDVYRPPQSQRFGESVGYTAWFELIGQNHYELFPNDAKHAIRNANEPPACGWIVDLRQNSGGNSWPMMVGVGPILGEGEVGGFVDNKGNKATWVYQDGQALVNGIPIENTFYPLDPMPNLPVAVLTSSFTASAGEMVLVAFVGRPNTRRFGEPSAGLTTGNNGIELSDGAFLNLAQVFAMDRNGNIYDGPVAPDEFVSIDWANYGTESDPVIQAALAWLDSEYNCQ